MDTNDISAREEQLIAHTTGIINNLIVTRGLAIDQIPATAAIIYSGLNNLGSAAPPPATKQAPAVDPKKSVFPDYIICLNDGKKFKSLKRHLMTDYGLTPEQYRETWGLKADYPMVAPNYSVQRSALAKASGLGVKRPPAPAAGKKK